jgi:hypothetical protein
MGVEYGQLVQRPAGDGAGGGSVAELADTWLAWAADNVVLLAVVAALLVVLLVAWRGSARRLPR